MIALGLILLVQQPQQSPTPQAPSPIARVSITPAVRSLTAGDTLRLSAQALDSAGRPMPEASIRFVGSGGRFEGRVDSTGLVYAGSTGTLGVSAVASVAGTRPVIERLEIRMLPGAAAEVRVTPEAARLVVGQSILLEARAVSTAGDWRPDSARVAQFLRAHRQRDAGRSGDRRGSRPSDDHGAESKEPSGRCRLMSWPPRSRRSRSPRPASPPGRGMRSSSSWLHATGPER